MPQEVVGAIREESLPLRPTLASGEPVCLVHRSLPRFVPLANAADDAPSEPEQSRTQGMPRSRPSTEATSRLKRPENLGDEAKSVLAVLALAALWPERFEDSWVSVTAFGRCGLLLGERVERESLKAALRRGLAEIGRLSDPPLVEKRRTRERDSTSDRLLREDDRRLREPIPLVIELWLLGAGGDYLLPELWREFLANEYRPALTLEEVTASLEETVVRTLLGQGRSTEAIDRARGALSGTAEQRERRPLELVLATSLMRRGRREDWLEADGILSRLSAEGSRSLDHRDRVTRARVLIARGYFKFFTGLRGVEPADVAHREIAVGVRALLADAAAIATDLSLSDRGQIANLEGLLRKWEAQVTDDASEKALLYDQAERYLRQALTLWRLAHDAYGLGVALYNLGELKFSRFQLHRGFGDEAEIRETLVWYEASIEYTETLGGLREWVLDYGKAAECLALLVPHYSRLEDRAAAAHVIARAREYLDRGTQHIAQSSWQQEMFTRVARMIAEAGRRWHRASAE